MCTACFRAGQERGRGRIGRAVLKLALERPELDVVAVNDLGDPANLAYLIRALPTTERYV